MYEYSLDQVDGHLHVLLLTDSWYLLSTIYPDFFTCQNICENITGYNFCVFNNLEIMEKAIDHYNLYNNEGEADTFKRYIFVFRLKKLIKREPEDAKYYFTLGMLHMDMQDYKEAEKDFKNCIKVSDL